jgi:hypothetical protein
MYTIVKQPYVDVKAVQLGQHEKLKVTVECLSCYWDGER